ncbi:MAG: adenylate/guanylate cyclase domain-containing protein, partial [Bacteroidota bacterium]
MNATRRLAAIMFTDIQGYTKLMQESEAKAVEVRTRHRNIFEPTTLTFGGEIIQYYGDGTLSIFSSTVDAVKCAIEMQIAFQKNPVIPVRIGIHTGDILISDQDIIGDSVNVASRIESLGIAGSITLSKKVADELINHEFFSLRSLGKFHFKNDRTSREVFAVQHPGIIVPAQRELQGKLEKKKLPKSKLILGSLLGLSLLIASLFITNTVFKPSEVKTEIRSLAVLPFSNMLEDRGETYLVDGVHEAIISELQEVGVEVKPRIAMMAYRDTDKSLQQISNELKVDGLIEGAVLKNGDSLMIKIRLINPFSEKYVWIESFDAKFKEAFSLYKEVTRYIAQKIQIA